MRKEVGLIILAACLSYAIYYAHKFFEIDYTVQRELEYFGCKATYKHSYTNFFFSNWNSYGHSTTNKNQIIYAKHKLVNCLCEKYMQTKDTLIEKFIIDFFSSDNVARNHYYFNILKGLNNSLKPDINELCKYKDEIFKYTPFPED